MRYGAKKGPRSEWKTLRAAAIEATDLLKGALLSFLFQGVLHIEGQP
jgi:hypothetical protein